MAMRLTALLLTTLILPAAVAQPAIAGKDPQSPASSHQPQWQQLDTTPFLQDPNEPLNFQGTPSPSPVPDPFSDPFSTRPLSPFNQSVVDPWSMLNQQMEEMNRMQRQMHDRVDRMMQMGPGMSTQAYGITTSSSGIEDRGDRYEIELQISGLDQATTSLEVEGNQLVLRATQQQESVNTPQGGVTSSFTMTNHIQQRWTLPTDADTAAIDAQATAGGLLITIPKTDQPPARLSIPIH
jgi:HSP20 family molecular chaperone IbpA